MLALTVDLLDGLDLMRGWIALSDDDRDLAGEINQSRPEARGRLTSVFPLAVVSAVDAPDTTPQLSPETSLFPPRLAGAGTPLSPNTLYMRAGYFVLSR